MTPDRVAGRLRELAVRHELDQGQIDRLSALLAIVAADEHAPTAVRDPAEAVDVHVADALSALDVAGVRAAQLVLDIGAGAGFPGLPLAVAMPAAEFRLLESNARKCAFIADCATNLELANVQVICARAEEWVQGAGVQDLVIARALAAQPVVLEYAAPLLTLGGRLVDWRGRRLAGEENSAAGAAAELGMRLVEIVEADPFPGAREHRIHVFEKVAPTPPRFPRRAGMARKRPLGV